MFLILPWKVTEIFHVWQFKKWAENYFCEKSPLTQRQFHNYQPQAIKAILKCPLFLLAASTWQLLVEKLWNSNLFAGITPTNELRDPPKYIRSVFSEPIDDETFYTEYNKEFGPEESETRCFQIWTKTKKKISKGKFQSGFLKRKWEAGVSIFILWTRNANIYIE